jgi:polyisoprenoid-binding protein YceI
MLLNTPSSDKRRRGPWLIAAVVLVPLAAIVAVYLLFFTDDSPDKLTLSETPATQPGATATTSGNGSATGLEGTWNVAQGSVAGYRVKEKLASLPAQSDAVARTESVTGTVAVRRDGSRLVADGVDVTVDVSTLKSDPAEAKRDNKIRTTGLETDQFPTATFTSTAPVTLPAGLEAGDAVKADVTGRLTMHGVTKDVTIPLDLRLTGAQGEVVGSLKFPFSDFGMSAPSIGGFVSVDSDATLEFKLLLTRG